MAVGLGGLYLLVRVRSEVHGDEAERDDDGTVDPNPPPNHGAGVAGQHPFPHTTNPPTWVKDERIWERARQHVRLHWHEYRDPWVVVAHVYEQMGGRTA